MKKYIVTNIEYIHDLPNLPEIVTVEMPIEWTIEDDILSDSIKEEIEKQTNQQIIGFLILATL